MNRNPKEFDMMEQRTDVGKSSCGVTLKLW